MKPLHRCVLPVLWTLLAWLPLSTLANDPASVNAPPTLEQIASRLQSQTLQQGRFQQRKYLSILPKPLLSSGFFLFQTSDQPSVENHRQLVWQVEAPLSSRLTFSDQGILQEQNGQQQWLVRGDQPGVATIAELMTALLTNNWSHLQRYFSIRVLPDSQLDQWQLQLTPRETPLADMIERIQMVGDDHLRHLTLWETGDNRTEIDFQPLTGDVH